VGNVYVADSANSTIREITPGGVVSTLAGLAGSQDTSVDATGSAARFYFPSGVAVDSAGNVYVADTGNSTIRNIIPGGVVGTLAGLAGGGGSADGTGSVARFGVPQSIAVDSSGNCYVADTGNNTIRKITPGGVVSTLAGQVGITGSTDGTGTNALFSYPTGVAVDSAGNVYVADFRNDTIRKIMAGGVVSTLAGKAGTSGYTNLTGTNAQFNRPVGVAVDSAGNVYVADGGNNLIRKITPGGVVSTLAGRWPYAGNTDGVAANATFYYPIGVAVDPSGNVYVADSLNNTIRKITPGGVVSTLAGGGSGGDGADGTGTNAVFSYSSGVAVDSAGNVYVADEADSTIRKVTPGGVVTTLAGLARSSGNTDGAGSAALFYGPYGVAVDSSGNVYVADTSNNTIRKGWVTPLLLSIGPDGSGGFSIQFQGTGNLNYQLLRAQAVNRPWTTNAVQTAPGTGLVEFDDTSPPPGQAFYRIVQ
jgi:streptogramin lyase